MEKINQLKQHADQLRLYLLRKEAEHLIHQAQIDKPTYLDYTFDMLNREVQRRKKNDLERKLKLARLPRNHDLEHYDYNFSSGIDKRQLQQLRELLWLEQAYNVVIMEPAEQEKLTLHPGLYMMQ